MDPTNIDKILAERGNRYGSFDGHALLTQQLKQTFLKYSGPTTRRTPSMDEALDMIFHKIGRIGNGDPYYIESWRDIVGYTQLVVNELQTTEGASDGRVISMKVIKGKLIDIP
jgi:hypothetical protein